MRLTQRHQLVKHAFTAATVSTRCSGVCLCPPICMFVVLALVVEQINAGEQVNVQVANASFFFAVGGTDNRFFSADGSAEFDTGSVRDPNGNVVPTWGQTALVFNPRTGG